MRNNLDDNRQVAAAIKIQSLQHKDDLEEKVLWRIKDMLKINKLQIRLVALLEVFIFLDFAYNSQLVREENNYFIRFLDNII